MYRYSRISRARLDTCIPELQDLFEAVLQFNDHSIIQGYRTEKQHYTYMLEGKTKVPYSRTYHRFNPSKAIDVAPYPIRWKDQGAFYVFAGVVMTIAKEKGYAPYLRWGGDWDRDGQYNDQTFYDLVHWEWRD